jgi:carboxypeptidase family protein
MTKRPYEAVLALGALVVLLAPCGRGQNRPSTPQPSSEVTGIVTDATGAVIPHSEVVFKGESGTLVSHTSTDGTVKVELRTGKYSVTVAGIGFVTAKLADFQINAPDPATFRLVLQVDGTPTDGPLVPGVATITSDLPNVIGPTAIHDAQESHRTKDCTSNHFVIHKTPCLCGKVQIASGDIGVDPVQMGLDDRLDVELRDRSGKLLESRQLIYKSEVPFCFSGKPKGKYALAFVLYESGKPQPAAVFPTNYTAKTKKECNAIYLVPPVCGN